MLNLPRLRLLALVLAATLAGLLTAVPAASRGQQRPVAVVCLDPGHGGQETGARSGALAEKDLSLAVCHALKERLEGLGYRAFLTRGGDFAVPVEDRTGAANNGQAEAFVSIHADAGFAEEARGPRVYSFGEAAVQPPRPGVAAAAAWRQVPAAVRSEGARLAGEIAAALRQGGEPVMVRQAPLLVLAGARMPAVMVEVGVLPAQAAELAAPEVQDRLAAAIAHGIDHFFRPPPPAPEGP